MKGTSARLGPNNTLFGPQVCCFSFLSLLYPLMVCFLSLGCKLLPTTLISNDTHCLQDDTTPTSNCSWGGTLSSPDNDNDMMSSSPAPVLKGACNCRSPEMQELLDDGRQWVNPCLPDPWLMTHRLQVQV
jgi:hypothetical protein